MPTPEQMNAAKWLRGYAIGMGGFALLLSAIPIWWVRVLLGALYLGTGLYFMASVPRPSFLDSKPGPGEELWQLVIGKMEKDAASLRDEVDQRLATQREATK